MPCPFFEPQQVASDPHDATARVPLIEEYEGSCRAGAVVQPVEVADRFRCCNHGYSRGNCARFPLDDARCAYRFHTVKSDGTSLDLIWIEERDYAPVRWESVRYSFLDDSLTPQPFDICLRAQVIAFCRSYRKRFLLSDVR